MAEHAMFGHLAFETRFTYMDKITLTEVERVRARFALARDDAALRFRESFASAPPDTPPNERWRAHLEIQAASMLDAVSGVRLEPGYRIAYFIDEARRMIAPVAHSGENRPAPAEIDSLPPEEFLYPFFEIDSAGEALLEYWMLTSELLSSADWKMTKLIASPEEHDAHLNGMDQPQIVNALFAGFLPEFEFQADGTAFLDLTIYTRAKEERIERRRLFLDANHELHYHSRQLIAEGRGGVN